MATAAGIRAGRAFVELGVNDSNFNKALRSAESRLRSFSSSAGALGASTVFGAAAIATPLALAVKTFADFDDQMRLTQAVTGSTGKAFEQLTEQAKQLGRTTSWTASEVGSGMAALGRAGFSATEINESIAGVMDLARATGTEIPLATDIAGNTLRQFGLEASQMGRVCDVMTAAANNSAQTLEDLGEAMKYAAPIAQKANLSLEDTAVLLASMANFGIKGSMAGTSLRNMLTQLADPKIQEEIKETFNFDVLDQNGNLKSLPDVILKIGAAASKLPNAERLAIFDKLFGKRPLAASLSLATANFNDLNDAIRNCDGTAQATAAQMDKGLGGAIRITKSAIEGAAIAIGEGLAPALTEFGTNLQNSLGDITAWVSANSALLVTGVKVGAVVTACGAALWGLGRAVGLVSSSIQLVHSTISGVSAAISFLTGATKAATAAAAAEAVVNTKRAALERAVKLEKLATTPVEYAQAVATRQLAAAELQEATAAATAATATASFKASLAFYGGLTAVVAAIAAGGYALYRWANGASKAAATAREASENAVQLSQAHEQQRTQDAALFEELKRLATQGSLTNQEFAHAQGIVAELTSRYGDLGIKCDAASRSISNMATAQVAFNKAQRQQQIQDIKNEIQKKKNELGALNRESKKFGYDTGEMTGASAVKGAGVFFGGESWEEGRIKNKEKRGEVSRDIASLEMRLNTALNEDMAASQDAAQGIVAPVQNGTTTAAAPVPVEIRQAPAQLAAIAPAVQPLDALKYQTLAQENTETETAQAIKDAAQEAAVVAPQLTSAGTFNAYEALDAGKDWERQEQEKQTQILQEVKDGIRHITKVVSDGLGEGEGIIVTV